MKKLFLFLMSALALSVGTFAQITPFAVYTIDENIEIAMDVNSSNAVEFINAAVYESGDDVEVLIFDNQLSVEKHFTLKGVLKYGPGEIRGNLNCLSLSNFDYIIVKAFRNFFVKNDKWCVLIGYRINNDSGGYDDICSIIDEDGKNVGTLPKESISYTGNPECASIYLGGFFRNCLKIIRKIC